MINFPDYPSNKARTWFQIEGFAYTEAEPSPHLERVSTFFDVAKPLEIRTETILHALAVAESFPKRAFIHWVEEDVTDRVDVAVVRLTAHQEYIRKSGEKRYSTMLLQTWERIERVAPDSLRDQLGGDSVAGRAANRLEVEGVKSIDDLIADLHRLGAYDFETKLTDILGFGLRSWERVREVMEQRGADFGDGGSARW